MKRLLFFFAILAVLFSISFGLSIWLFPNWLAQPGWILQLSGIIILAGLSVVGTEILSKSLSFLFEDKDLNERLSFVFGNKYQNISKRLDEFTLQEIGKEKASRKYIPNIFVETTEIKEKLRYFSEPFLFFSKIVEQTDRELRGTYIVSALKQVHYPIQEPVYPNLHVRSSNHKSLTDSIQKYRTYLDQKLALTDILIKKDGAGIKPEYITNIPQEFSHIHTHIYPVLQFYWSYEYSIGQAKEDLDILKSKFVITKSIAGHGKTNLLCDFTENFLLKKGHKCLYVSARTLNHLGEQETFEQAVTRTVFADSDIQFSDVLRLTKFDKRIDFLFILIDGINEHKDLPLFSRALEQFLQRCSGYNIKIILTCRSEYFDDRFGNLLHLDGGSVLDMDEWKYNNKIPDVHIETLLSKYFSEFKVKLSADNVDSDTMKVLNKDKLLLRIFCEAYENEQPAEYLDDLYKLEIFHKYYQKKTESILGLDNCLNELVVKMISDNQFTNIQISELSVDTKKVVENTVYENVIIKKDILVNPDLAFGKSEVINFVYDEFRDFLIASYVILEWDRNNQSSKDIIQSLATHNSTVSEGLQRYLCLWSIKNNKNDLLDYLSSQEWFDKNFIISAFETPAQFLSSFVTDRIHELFVKNPTNALRIIWRSARRANTVNYPNLNIELMFNWLDQFDDTEYERIIVSALSKEYDYESTHVTQLCQRIVDAFRKSRVSDASRNNLIKLLAYLIGIEDYSYLRAQYSELGRNPASEALYIVAEVTGAHFVQEAIGEVVLSCGAEAVKSQLLSISGLIGEE